jgi:hypothetical protein
MKANIGKLVRKFVVLALLLASFIYVSSAPQTAKAWCPDWQVCWENHHWDCWQSQCVCDCPVIIYDPNTWEPIGEYCPNSCA